MNGKNKNRAGLFRKNSNRRSGKTNTKITEEEKQALLNAAKKISDYCKENEGYCFDCPLAKYTQMCIPIPDSWNIQQYRGDNA